MDILSLNLKELTELIELNSKITSKELLDTAFNFKKNYYGNKIFARGLIEFSNCCKNNCYYCGISASNRNIKRYRLSKDEILNCCNNGHGLGFKTFVLQSGEDLYYSTKILCDIISSIKEKYPQCAVTLSIGEKTKEEYQEYKKAGADRFLLRHETADDLHYQKLHPEDMLLESRKRCLFTLKELGYQTGAGFMVGSPYQTYEHLAKDLLFLKELEPEMVGIGPFIPHCDTKFKSFLQGSLDLTYTMIALTRIILPTALIPATTAVSTIDQTNGRKNAFSAGANVIMPNLTPQNNKENYSLYNNKLSTNLEDAIALEKIKKEIELTGNILDLSRGDHFNFNLDKGETL